MKENTFPKTQIPQSLSIEEIARQGVQQILKIYLEAEIQTFISNHSHIRLENGSSAVVRNGYHEERPFTTTAGTFSVKVPRSRDRSKGGVKFSSAIVPKYMRRSLSVDEAVPLLYLLGISSNDIVEGVESLLGSDVKGLSPANITKMKAAWGKEYDTWKKRDLSDKHYCYIWADGIHFNLRHDDNRLCTLVVIGALADGRKELIAVESGYRESTESWSYLLRDLHQRKLKAANLAIGDGALGFWNALKNVYPETRCQRCWVHKTANIMDKLPKGVQCKAKSMLHQIYMAESSKDANIAYKRFISMYSAKYPKAIVRTE